MINLERAVGTLIWRDLRRKNHLGIVVALNLCCICVAFGQPPSSRKDRERVGARGPQVGIDTSGNISIEPNPDSRWSLFLLLMEHQVQRELQLTESQIESAYVLLKDGREKINSVGLESARGKRILETGELVRMHKDLVKQAEDAIEEILLPDQLKRLEQLAYRIEVLRLGFPLSLTKGHLSRLIEVHESQVTTITRKAAILEEQANKRIDEIRRQYESEVLDLLTPEQRNAAKEALGGLSNYSETTDFQSILESAQKTHSARTGNDAKKP
jgi:hypothetical protein